MRLTFQSCLVVLTLLGHNGLLAQIDVDQSLTITEYVNDVLLGEGVSATNIQFIGSMEQIGYMTGGGSANFPIEGGLVLSSGNAADAFCAGMGCMNCQGGSPTDNDLLTIANSVPPLIGQSFSVSSVNDLCVLEFDFDPAGDYVSFNYVFGSSEYEAWENSQYNDIFAFFLSGAGINGPYAAPGAFPGQAINIASVPDSDPELPITISSVNGSLNAEYYILNESPDVCMNGYTTVLTAVYPVICGETYHIKLAIGDGSDTILDSVVILEEGSFGSPIPTTYESQASPECDPDPNDEDIIYCAWEDCGPSTITISRPCAVSSLFPFPFDLIAGEGSEATLDEDILGLPSSAAIPVGEYGMSLTFEVPQDFIDEGTETLYLRVVSGTIESEIQIIIYDTPPLEATMPELVTVPCDETAEVCVDLIQDPNYAYPPVTFDWSINGLDFGEDQCVTYGSLVSSLMEVHVEDGCGRELYLDGLFDVPYDPLVLSMPNDTLLCNGAETFINLGIEGGQPPYQVAWSDFPDDELIHLVDPDESTTYEVLVTDNCAYEEFESTKVDVQIVTAGILQESLGDDTYKFQAVVSPEEPYLNAYGYEWNFGDGEFGYGSETTHKFDGLSTYQTSMSVTTNIGCSATAYVDIYGELLFYIPTAFTPDNDGLNDAFVITGRQVRLFEIWIYNRWGEQVFYSNDVNTPWLGDVNGGTHFAENGVYHWVIKAADYVTDAQEFRGFVQLMR